jgi:hypothetical protein
MIREALELLSRPLRKRHWERRRQWIAQFHKPIDENYNPLAESDHVCFPGGPPEIPCAWEERDAEDVKQDVHRWLDKRRELWKKRREILMDSRTGRVAEHDLDTGNVNLGEGLQAKMFEVEEFLQRAKKDLKKKKFVGGLSTPIGSLPEGYVPLPESEDRWIDVGHAQERLSAIMDYYARHYRWNPLEMDEDINFACRDRATEERFWKAYRQSKAIAFYRKAMGVKEPKKNADGSLDLFAHFGMNDED